MIVSEFRISLDGNDIILLGDSKQSYDDAYYY